MAWMIRIGLVELAIGGSLGWAMLTKAMKPEVFTRMGLRDLDTIRKVHLDYVFMGLILIGIGLAVPSLPKWIAIPLVFGTIMNPFLFIPPALNPKIVRNPAYILLNLMSFVGVSGGLIAVAIRGPG